MIMTYYLYLITSFVCDFIITAENSLLESLRDLWRPILMFPLLFSACVIIHVMVIAVISLFADRNKRWTSLDNIYRKVTLETIDLLLHIMRVRLHVSGAEQIPDDKRFLFIGNHLSIFDPMIAMLTFKDKELAFVSKKENIEIPFGGRLMLASGCLALDRENNRSAVKTIKAASAQLTDNIASMGIYPEGGINKTDDILLPFHSGSFKIAKKASAPIVVTTIRNTEQLCRRFLFASTDVYLDVLSVIQPEEIKPLKTTEISSIVWNEMYEHLAGKYDEVPEPDTENQKAAC